MKTEPSDYSPVSISATRLRAYLDEVTVQGTFARINAMVWEKYTNEVACLCFNTKLHFDKRKQANLLRSEQSSAPLFIAIFGFLLTTVETWMLFSQGSKAVNIYDMLLCVFCTIGGTSMFIWDRTSRSRYVEKEMLQLAKMSNIDVKLRKLLDFLRAETSSLHEEPHHLDDELVKLYLTAVELETNKPN